jgi:hypothetical protein
VNCFPVNTYSSRLSDLLEQVHLPRAVAKLGAERLVYELDGVREGALSWNMGARHSQSISTLVTLNYCCPSIFAGTHREGVGVDEVLHAAEVAEPPEAEDAGAPPVDVVPVAVLELRLADQVRGARLERGEA